MRHLVIDRRLSAKQLRERRALAIDEGLFVVEHSARMLHSAEGKGWSEHEVELLERKGLCRVSLQPGDRTRVDRDERISFDLL